MTSARVVFVNRYFYPDLSATSQMLSDLAFHLAESGLRVVVVTGRRCYIDARAALPAKERIRGVDIIRIATTGFGRTTLPGRAADYVSFYFSAFLELVRTVSRNDIVVAKTDPPLLSVVAALVCRLRGARQVNWLQDLFPEVALVIEPALLSKSTARLVRRLRDWSLRRADANVVPGELMARKVAALGMMPQRLVTIPNWADDRMIRRVSHRENPIRSEWGLEGQFVVSYSGNLGRAHEFRTFLEAARLLRHRRDVTFVVIGGGAQLEEVRRLTSEFGLSNIREFPYQPRERLPWSLGAADLHLVSLLPALEGFVVPSKFYGIAAASRPVAFIGDRNGEIGALLERHECGTSIAIGDARGLADFILRLAGDPGECERLGDNARRALDALWSQAQAFERWRSILRAVETGAEHDSPGVGAAAT